MARTGAIAALSDLQVDVLDPGVQQATVAERSWSDDPNARHIVSGVYA